MAFKTVASTAKTIVDITDAYSVTLSNEAVVIACDASGTPVSGQLGATGVTVTTVSAYKGAIKLSSVAAGSTPAVGQFKYVLGTAVGCTAVRKDDTTFYLSAISADGGNVPVTIYLENGTTSISKTFTFGKTKTGASTYTWVKYASDINGTNMSDDPTDKKYVGMAFNKTTSIESNTATDYTWTPLYDNVKVGGTNLYPTSGQFGATVPPSTNWSSNGGGLAIDTTVNWGNYNTIKTTVGSGITGKWYRLDNGVEYTYSVMLMASDAFTGSSNMPLHYWAGLNDTNQSKITVTGYDTSYTASDVGKFKRLYVTFKLNSDANSFKPYIYFGTGTTVVMNIAYLKLERGNVPSDWSAAPEDLIYESKDYNGVILNKQNGIEVTSSKNKLTMNATKGIEVIKNIDSSKVFSLDSNTGDLTVTGNINMTGGNITWGSTNPPTSTSVKDTRSTNELPSWYYTNYPKQVVSEFKTRATIGAPGTQTYGTLDTSVPWSDTSGGAVVQVFRSLDGVYQRQGNAAGTAWGAWEKPDSTYSEMTTNNQIKGMFYVNGSELQINADKITTGKLLGNYINAKNLTVNNGTKDTLKVDSSGNVTIDGTVYINSSSQFAQGYDPSKQNGGRNILLNSRFATADMTGWSNWGTATRVVEDITDLPGFDKAVKITTTASNQGLYQTIPVVNGNTYTASCYVKSSTGQGVIQIFDGVGYPSKTMDVADAGANKWVKLYFVFTAKATTVQLQIGKSGGGSIGTYWFTGVKLEDGDKSTGWNPAQEDIDGLIDKVVSPKGDIKSFDIASSIAVTPGAIDIVSKNINLKGKVTFSDLASGWALDELGNKISNSDQPDYDPNNPLYLDVDGNYRPLTDEKNFLASLFTKDDDTGVTVIDGNYIKTGTIQAKNANFRDVQIYNDSGQQTFWIDSQGNLSTSGTSQSIDYEEQKKGWKIDADGSAEFNAATFRGDIELGYYDTPTDSFVVTGGLLSGKGGTGKDLRFWAGSDKNNAPFKVYSDGTLEATQGYFTGTFSGEINVGNINIKDTAAVGDAKITLTDNSKIEKVVLSESLVKINTLATFGTFLTVDQTNQILKFGANDFNIDYKNNTIKMKSFSIKGSTSLEFTSDGSSGDDFVFKNIAGDTSVRVDGSFITRDDIEVTDTLRMKKATDVGNKGIDFVFI
ncbi:hypothetical protein ABWK22_02540 [Gottfriedia acidiceleris]|uniref:phage head spike fiber domain-containing protein n=1 Tax=Gottfriedia acidiceleris TaxID=371036 RepID=UPI00339A2234